MKNTIRILGFAIVMLVLVQLVSMFMPYFDFSEMTTDPEEQTEFSIQEYVWIHTNKSTQIETIDLGTYFKKLIDDYHINDHAEGLALTFLVGCVVVLLTFLNFANSFNKFVTFRAAFINVITHIASIAWCAIALSTYLTSAVLTVEPADPRMYMIGLVSVFAVTGFVALRLIVDIAASASAAKKARLERRAARQAA